MLRQTLNFRPGVQRLAIVSWGGRGRADLLMKCDYIIFFDVTSMLYKICVIGKYKIRVYNNVNTKESPAGPR